VLPVGDYEYFLLGLVIGLGIGLLAGLLLSKYTGQQAPASVIFDRDSQGRITAIHYVPGVKSG